MLRFLHGSFVCAPKRSCHKGQKLSPLLLNSVFVRLWAPGISEPFEMVKNFNSDTFSSYYHQGGPGSNATTPSQASLNKLFDQYRGQSDCDYSATNSPPY
jgi:hypothetical protein